MLFVTIRVDLSWFESGLAGVIGLEVLVNNTCVQKMCSFFGDELSFG